MILGLNPQKRRTGSFQSGGPAKRTFLRKMLYQPQVCFTALQNERGPLLKAIDDSSSFPPLHWAPCYSKPG